MIERVVPQRRLSVRPAFNTEFLTADTCSCQTWEDALLTAPPVTHPTATKHLSQCSGLVWEARPGCETVATSILFGASLGDAAAAKGAESP